MDKYVKDVFTQADNEKAHVDFYADLYSESEIDNNAETSLLDGIPRVLIPVDRDCCEGEIALHEATHAVKNLKLDKAPGPDGLTVEFLKCIWKLFGPKLVEVANESFKDKELSETIKESVTRILIKKGDQKKLKNWRPILMKITRSFRRSCLSKVLDTIIDSDQACFAYPMGHL